MSDAKKDHHRQIVIDIADPAVLIGKGLNALKSLAKKRIKIVDAKAKNKVKVEKKQTTGFFKRIGDQIKSN